MPRAYDDAVCERRWDLWLATSAQMIDGWEDWANRFPSISLADGLADTNS